MECPYLSLTAEDESNVRAMQSSQSFQSDVLYFTLTCTALVSYFTQPRCAWGTSQGAILSQEEAWYITWSWAILYPHALSRYGSKQLGIPMQSAAEFLSLCCPKFQYEVYCTVTQNGTSWSCFYFIKSILMGLLLLYLLAIQKITEKRRKTSIQKFYLQKFYLKTRLQTPVGSLL